MEKQMKEETIMEENKKKNPDSERKSKLVDIRIAGYDIREEAYNLEKVYMDNAYWFIIY